MVVHESDMDHGGLDLEDAKETCPADLRAFVFGNQEILTMADWLLTADCRVMPAACQIPRAAC